MTLSSTKNHCLLWCTALLLAIGVYFYGLNSDHLATNGDELLYAQIAKATAQSGHLLPLQSPIQRLENTKPPLLFWQGIFSTDHAQHWSLVRLRYPSVIATLLVAFLVLLLGERSLGSWSRGILGALIYLAFFGVYRYGRCFLTSGPETWWLFFPFFLFLYAPRWSSSWWATPFLGIALGIGLLYKSVFLVIPVALGIAWHLLDQRGYRRTDWFAWLKSDLPRVALMSIVAIALFSLWFLGDPHPGAIIKDFLIRENLAKFDAGSGHYLWNLFIGGSSIWRNVIAYPLNAGLLAPLVVGLFFLGYRKWRQNSQKKRALSSLRENERPLWIWIITLFFIFTLPNQRDERYLLLGMPALALLLLLYWEELPSWLFTLCLAITGIIVAGMGGLSLLLQHQLLLYGWPHPYYSPLYWLILIGTEGVILFGLTHKTALKALLPVGVLLLYLCYAAFLWPFDGSMGHFSAEAQKSVLMQEIWVPTNFNAREESYRFLLLKAGNLHPYDYHDLQTIDQLENQAPLLIETLPLETPLPSKEKNHQLLGRRLNLIDRFNNEETQQMLHGKITPLLFHQDLLLQEKKEEKPLNQ